MTSPNDEIAAPASPGSTSPVPPMLMGGDGAFEQERDGSTEQTNLEAMLRLARAL